MEYYNFGAPSIVLKLLSGEFEDLEEANEQVAIDTVLDVYTSTSTNGISVQDPIVSKIHA